jgi:ABC-2 type transport system ATP-binding protein
MQIHLNPGGAEPAITVSGVSYLYPGTRALDHVSFGIERGSVTALVGPNGAGKTTLLRCLAGLDAPLSGAIRVAGIDVLEEPRLARSRLGHLSDFFGLYDALTVRQCFTHAASTHGVAPTAVASTVAMTAERLGLAGRLENRCSELSRGLRQRVAIGQAIVHAPQVLLLDEPASGLDPEARHALANLFNGLREQGMTLVVSSHILAELDEYSTHMLVLRTGKVVEHRALGEVPADGRRVRLALANPPPRWREALRALHGVAVLELASAGAVLAVPGDAGDRARVLRDLVMAGLPVAAYFEETENLHASYLRSMQPEKPKP